MPSNITCHRRLTINKYLKDLSYELPKRNVFLMKVKDEAMIKKIKEWIIFYSKSAGKINYYQLAE
jgi:hypothetical protein